MHPALKAASMILFQSLGTVAVPSKPASKHGQPVCVYSSNTDSLEVSEQHGCLSLCACVCVCVYVCLIVCVCVCVWMFTRLFLMKFALAVSEASVWGNTEESFICVY